MIDTRENKRVDRGMRMRMMMMMMAELVDLIREMDHDLAPEGYRKSGILALNLRGKRDLDLDPEVQSVADMQPPAIAIENRSLLPANLHGTSMTDTPPTTRGGRIRADQDECRRMQGGESRIRLKVKGSRDTMMMIVNKSVVPDANQDGETLMRPTRVVYLSDGEDTQRMIEFDKAE